MFTRHTPLVASCGLLLASFAPTQTFVRKIPDRPALGSAHDVAVEASGNLWVAAVFDELVKLDAAGNELLRIARQFRSGTGASTLLQPTSVAVGAAGTVYVTTRSGNYVVRFDANGDYLGAFGGAGSGNGQFGGNTLGGLAVAANGDVLVVDLGGHRVQRFDALGNFLLAFGSAGSGNGQFDFLDGVTPMLSTGIAVDAATGDILVVDRGNLRVQRFDAAGNWLSAFPVAFTGSFGSAFADLVKDGAGRWVVSTSNGPLLAFSDAGVLQQTAFPTFGGISGQNNGLGVDGAGGVLVAGGNGGRVLRLDASLATMAAYGNPWEFSTDGVFFAAAQVLFEANGDLLVADGTTRLQRFDGTGAFVGKQLWAQPPGSGINAGQALARDSTGAYYTAGSTSGVQRVMKFTAGGAFVQAIGNFGAAFVRAIACDAADNLWVITGGSVQRLDATGVPVVTIPAANANGITVDGAGRILIADAALGVRIHDVNGALLQTVTAPGLVARSVLVDAGGRIFVGSNGGGVHIFNPAGVRLVAFGKRGTADGDVAQGAALALRNGLLAVADTGAHRVQIFDVSLLDQQIPVVQILAPALTNAVDGAVVTTNTIPVTVHVQDDSATTVVANLAGVFGVLPAGGGTVTGSVQYPNVADGSFTLGVNATDGSSNVAGTSLTITRDTAAPVFGAVTPAEGTVFGTASVNLLVHVADLTSKTLTVSHGGGTFVQAGASLLAATVPVTLQHGSNTIELTATDAAGHVTTMTRTLVADLTAPIVEFVGLGGPADPDCFGPGQSSLAVTVGVTDLTATTVSSNPAGVSGALPAGGGFLTGTVALVEGANTITVSASDGYRTAAAVVTVTYDATAPTVAFDSPAPSQVVQGTVHVVVPADDDFADTTPGCGIGTLVFTVDGNQVEAQAGNGDGLYEFDLDTTTLANGSHVLVATATDGVGNVGSVSVTFVVDNPPPVSLTYDFAPDSLNLRNKGQGVVTAHLEGATVPALVPIASHVIELRVRGGNAVGALAAGGVGDSDLDLLPDLTIRFDRSALIASIRAGILGGLLPANGDVDIELWIDGSLVGSSPVRVKS